MLTSAPAIAAPCSSETAPRTEAVITCACAVKAVEKTSARTASSETTTRKLMNDSFVFKNRIFIRLPLEEIFARKKRARNPKKNYLPRTHFLFHPTTDSRKDLTPKALPGVMLLY